MTRLVSKRADRPEPLGHVPARSLPERDHLAELAGLGPRPLPDPGYWPSPTQDESRPALHHQPDDDIEWAYDDEEM